MLVESQQATTAYIRIVVPQVVQHGPHAQLPPWAVTKGSIQKI